MGFFPTLSSSPTTVSLDHTGINILSPPLSNSPPLFTTTPSPLVGKATKPLATAEPTTRSSIVVVDNSLISISGSISGVKGSNSSSNSRGKKKRVTGTPLFSNASVRSYKS